MFTTEVQSALRSIQAQCDVTKASTDTFELDRNERALDELVRNAANSAAPGRLVRSARANALKVVRSRAQLGEFSLDEADLHVSKRARAERAAMYDPIAELELLDWLAGTHSVTPAQRDLLQALALGHDAEYLACRMGVPVQRVRERISRARRAAHAGYVAEVKCA